ncbi:MAG: DNA polymerase Y family protein [Leucobacter sp.]
MTAISAVSTAERTLVFWVPDWPVRAWALEQQSESGEDRAAGTRAAPLDNAPLALVSKRRIVACSAAARAEGVRVGSRENEAQSHCPELVLFPHDPDIDERRFAPVLAALERLVPGVEPRRPGLCAMRARGPARYYGGEEAAAAALIEAAARLGLSGARVGIADGLFTAEQAARAVPGAPGVAAFHEAVRIVPPGGSSAFLSPLPITRAVASEFAEVLNGLGIRTLGALAALPEDAVRQRFGAEGLAAHRRARAVGANHGSEVRPRPPVRDLAVELSFEPPIDAADRLAFACVTLAERFIGALAEERLVCTALRVELTDDTGARHEREWAHPYRFTAPDTVDRVRWQAASAAHATERGGAGITQLRITPTHTDRAAAHEPGLWSAEPDSRVHHHLSRVQSRLGHTSVGTARLIGGRLLAERQLFVPWSTKQTTGAGNRASAAGPWPGSLTGPTPSAVFPEPMSVELLDKSGSAIAIDADDLLTVEPVRLRVPHTAFERPVSAWSLPWPVRERWWEKAPERLRLQVLLDDGNAWLLLYEAGKWFAEGQYD